MARKRKDELLKDIAEFFRSGGVRLASVEDIAQALGVARSALYYHFGSRGDMVFEILCHNQDLIAAKVLEVYEFPLDASDRLTLMLRAVVQLEAELPSLGLSAVFRLDPDLLTAEQRAAYVAKRDAYEELFRKVIREGAEAGEFRELDARIVTFGILGMLTEFVNWYRPGGALRPTEIAAIFTDLVLNGLHPNSRAATSKPSGRREQATAHAAS
jgi:AcrR family transcriptional regulator